MSHDHWHGGCFAAALSIGHHARQVRHLGNEAAGDDRKSLLTLHLRQKVAPDMNPSLSTVPLW
jgi:hypothetical protein